MMSIAETTEEYENDSGFGPPNTDSSFAPIAVPPPPPVGGGGAFQSLTNPIHNILSRISNGYQNGYEGLDDGGDYYQDSDIYDDDVNGKRYLDEESPR
eukprot:2624115-Ditylum_brightwellii.AAC.1